MDIQRALTFMTEDENWIKKLGIGVALTLFSFLILPIFIITGYGIQVARNVKDGMDVPLPEWDTWGDYLREGFVVALAGLIYAIPALALFLIGGIVAGAGGATDVDALIATGGVVFALLACLGSIYLLAMIAIGPAIYVQYINHGSLGACLNFREVFGIVRENIGDIVMTMLVFIGIGIVMSVIGVIPCIGTLAILALTPWFQIVTAHLYGQIAAKVGGGGTKGDKFDEMSYDI